MIIFRKGHLARICLSQLLCVPVISRDSCLLLYITMSQTDSSGTVGFMHLNSFPPLTQHGFLLKMVGILNSTPVIFLQHPIKKIQFGHVCFDAGDAFSSCYRGDLAKLMRTTSVAAATLMLPSQIRFLGCPDCVLIGVLIAWTA